MTPVQVGGIEAIPRTLWRPRCRRRESGCWSSKARSASAAPARWPISAHINRCGGAPDSAAVAP